MIRVASVPSGHVYVRRLEHPDGNGVIRLADPPPPEASTIEQWWPPVMLTPGWVPNNADDFDVFHIQFGFDACSPADLERLVTELRRAGKPLVYTVHDLRNPHQPDRRMHDAALDVLVPAADALITLTDGAAQEIWERWGRDALVLPHPHVVDDPWLERARPERDDRAVGLHLKSLRANMNPLPVLKILADQIAERPGMRLVVDVHTDVVTPGMRNHDAAVTAMLDEGKAAGLFDVHVHDYYTDDELYEYFQSLDLSVLPYRFGTHSGWLEACFDLGTRVLAPDVGYYSRQKPGVLSYHVREDGQPDEDDIASALDAVQAADEPWRADRAQRRRERIALADAHRDLYQSLLERE